ncbi:MAG: peptidase M15 [SAR324 cluster bacterium]|nr:peptidase M15 [SAR324 cluster bacterium]
MRSFLHSEIADIYGLGNIPGDPVLAAESGRKLCENVLEPIQAALGPITIRSAFRSAEVNDLGNKKNHQCSNNEKTAANHIWDMRDKDGYIGATTTIIVNSFVDYYEKTGDWQALAWWIHDHIPEYSYMEFYPLFSAFNIGWHENPDKPKSISSRIPNSQGYLTKEGMDNFEGDHSQTYRGCLVKLERR